jgi:hypothetical protein
MWGRRKKAATPDNAPVAPLKEALRQARIDSAERTGLILEMRDAEAARLEILNDALDPVFADIPQGVEIFDRGVSRGDVPRLWIDIVASVLMGRDKRTYRFVQDTRYGRKVLHESADIPDMAKAITRYVAARLIERERALVNGRQVSRGDIRRRPWRAFGMFVLGFVIGLAALLLAALIFGGS